MSRQPKYDHLKQMANVAVERNPRKQQKNYANHRRIYPSANQQRALIHTFTEERNLYNNFIKYMQPRLKSSPEFYSEMGERHVMLFIKMAQLGFDIRTISNRKSKRVELPKLLEPYRDILFGISEENEKGVDETLAIFLEVCRHRAAVLTDTRKNMASEFIRFYMEQSRSKDNRYILEEVNNMQKRHIQISKPHVGVKIINNQTEYGVETHTELTIPHIGTPLIMRDNINELQPWNILIIHKDPSELDLGNTILYWEADFRQTDNQYLIKYVETPNPISKMESRFIRR